MGKMSRNKGRRSEYIVRDLLRVHGHRDAVRVPLSGASEGFKGDVVYTAPDGSRMTIEVKSRKASFKTLYERYKNTVIHHPVYGAICVFEWGENVILKEVMPANNRDIKRFETLYALKAGADLLAIKDNGKEVLFIEWEMDHGVLPL
jgi:Holliday junction resolvase